MERITKKYATFDCDAHVNDPLEIWSEYVPESKKELVRQTYWRDAEQAVLNGSTLCSGGGAESERTLTFNPVCIGGPQINNKIIGRISTMLPLSGEQTEYLRHQGAFDPHARIREMDLMGIDQVLVIPTMVIMNVPFAENADGVKALCEAYNNWLRDWCDEVPGRLWGAGMLPLQNPTYAAEEVRRCADQGFPVALIRPIDALGKYPNVPAEMVGLPFAPEPTMDLVFRTFEDTGVCVGMHTFPEPGVGLGRAAGPGMVASPGQYAGFNGGDGGIQNSFLFEAQTWLAQVLLSGFLDRYPKLKMLIFESNSQWLTYLLAHCDRLFKLYRNERRLPAKRLPSEAFYEQCAISFESDEAPMFEQWQDYEDIAIWASDAYHSDASDAWTAIRTLRESDVPEDVQEKLMGANARRFYGIEPKVFVTEEPPSIERPSWFPQGSDFQEWIELGAHTRRNAEKLRAMVGQAVAPAASARYVGHLSDVDDVTEAATLG